MPKDTSGAPVRSDGTPVRRGAPDMRIRASVSEPASENQKKATFEGVAFFICRPNLLISKEIGLVARGGIEPPTQGFSISLNYQRPQGLSEF